MTSRTYRSGLLIALILSVCLGPAHGDPNRFQLAVDTSLREGPGGGNLAGLLTAGAEIRMIQEQEGWREIQIQGWIPAASLTEENPASGVFNANLAVDTSLRKDFKTGALAGLLTAGAAVTVLQTAEDDWLQVQVRGWVPATALAQLATAERSEMTAKTVVVTTPPADDKVGTSPDAAVSTSSPPPSPTSVATKPPASATRTAPAIATLPATKLEGTVAVKPKRKRIIWGEGVTLMLLPGALDLARPSAEEEARLMELTEEAKRLKKEADMAMRKGSLSEATEKYDKLMGKRRGVMNQRSQLLAVLHGRRETEARAAALDSAVAGIKGFYIFSTVQPGSYQVYARLANKDYDLEWLRPVDVGSEVKVLDLDETIAHGLFERAP